MQIRQRLRINTAIFLVSVLALILILAVAAARVSKAMEASRIADAILAASFERLLLRTDLHRTGSERTKIQLIAKHAEVGRLLNKALSKFTEPEAKKLITELLAVHESTGKLSKTIRENREKGYSDTHSAPLALEREDRLLSQLNMKVYETIILDTRLQAMSNEVVYSSIRTGTEGALAVLLLLSAITVLNSVTVNRTISARIGILRDGAVAIGGGDLDHRIEVNSTDEFGELAVAMNAMAVELLGLYAERKRVEETLVKAKEELIFQVEERTKELREKEVLLQEVHHRVKNNLQVISSLVSLQADATDDQSVRDVLRDVTDRVRSMALVHEKLYRSTDLARVDFAEYIKSLLGYLWRAHGTQSSSIDLALDLEPIFLPVDVAVPCGLILNELAANTLKHAFRNRADGKVTISLQAAPDGRTRLRVDDNGVGLPGDFDWRQSSSLGIRLVQMLVKQLDATMEIASTGNGTTCEMHFRSHP